MNDFLKRLEDGPLLLLDGGLGTGLMERGLPAGIPPETWTLEKPEELLDIHRAYVDAGSEAVHANTFGANPVRLAKYGLEFQHLNIQAVQLARQSGAPFVIADMGPTGEYLPPVGKGDVNIWRQAFEAQARVLLEADVDAIHIETMSDIREAHQALSALRNLSTKIPVMVSLTFDKKKKGFFTAFGDPLVESMQSLADHGATVVGANCSLASSDMQELALEASGRVHVPLVFQPNAGKPELTESGTQYSQLPDEFAADMVTMVKSLGNRLAAIGGCCGTDPRHIQALKKLLEENNIAFRRINP